MTDDFCPRISFNSSHDNTLVRYLVVGQSLGCLGTVGADLTSQNWNVRAASAWHTAAVRAAKHGQNAGNSQNVPRACKAESAPAARHWAGIFIIITPLTHQMNRELNNLTFNSNTDFSLGSSEDWLLLLLSRSLKKNYVLLNYKINTYFTLKNMENYKRNNKIAYRYSIKNATWELLVKMVA